MQIWYYTTLPHLNSHNNQKTIKAKINMKQNHLMLSLKVFLTGLVEIELQCWSCVWKDLLPIKWKQMDIIILSCNSVSVILLSSRVLKYSKFVKNFYRYPQPKNTMTGWKNPYVDVDNPDAKQLHYRTLYLSSSSVHVYLKTTHVYYSSSENFGLWPVG